MYKYNWYMSDTLKNREYWIDESYSCKKEKGTCPARQINREQLPKIYVPKTHNTVEIYHLRDKTTIKIIPDSGNVNDIHYYNIGKKNKILNCKFIGTQELDYRLFSASDRELHSSINIIINSEKKICNGFSIIKYIQRLSIPSCSGCGSLGLFDISYVYGGEASCVAC
jgi:hypothetical protein